MLHERSNSSGARAISPRRRHQAVLRRRIGPCFKHMDVRRLMWMREKNKEKDHRRGNLPNDDGLPAPLTFLKLSASLQAQVLKERSIALSQILPQVAPAAAWRLYSHSPGLLCFWTLEVARRFRMVARMTGRSYPLIVESSTENSAASLLLKSEKVGERCLSLARALDPSLGHITVETVLRRVLDGPHLLISKPRRIKSACLCLRNGFPALSLQLCFHIVASEASLVSPSLTTTTLTRRISKLYGYLSSLLGSSQNDRFHADCLWRHPKILSLPWEKEEDNVVSRFVSGIEAISRHTGASLPDIVLSFSNSLLQHISSSKEDTEARVKASVNLWREITLEDRVDSLLSHPDLIFQNTALTSFRWDALNQACYRCTQSSSTAHRVADIIKTCPKILTCPHPRSAYEMNIEVSSRIKHLARLLSLERPHLSAQEAASDSWDMICRCPTLIVHDAPSPKRMAIEAGLAAMGKESNMAMVSKRDKEEALVRGIRMGRVSPLILAARPGAALRGRKTLTRNEQTTTASRMFGYYDRGASTERWSKKGILAGLPSDLVSELISVRPDLMISVEARRSLDGMMNEVGELLGGLKRNSKASIQLLIHHPWLIDYEGLDLIVSPEVVLSVDQSLGGGHLGRLKSFELILLLMAQAQPALPADMSISPDLKIHLETLVASIKEEDTWASELGRCVDLYDQKSLVRILHLANSNSLMAMDRLATLKTLGLSSKISFLSAVTMNQADFDRLAVRSPSKIISAEPESNRRRGYIKRQ